MEKYTIWIDGGIGRILTSLPAIKEFVKQHPQTKVITTWLDPFINLDYPDRIYRVDSNYLWDDIIKYSKLLKLEPYWNYNYYNQKQHIIQTFFEEMGLPIPEEIPRPDIILKPEEEIGGRKTISQIKQRFNKNKVIIFQPFGASAKLTNENGEVSIKDESNRSLELNTMTTILKELSKDNVVVVMSSLDLSFIPNIEQPKINLRGWMSLIKYADKLIGVDSVMQHIAFALDKKAFTIFGGTYPENVGYKDFHIIFKKENYPKEYNPIRLPSREMFGYEYNKKAMQFDKAEEQELLSKIKEYIK